MFYNLVTISSSNTHDVMFETNIKFPLVLSPKKNSTTEGRGTDSDESNTEEEKSNTKLEMASYLFANKHNIFKLKSLLKLVAAYIVPLQTW